MRIQTYLDLIKGNWLNDNAPEADEDTDKFNKE